MCLRVGKLSVVSSNGFKFSLSNYMKSSILRGAFAYSPESCSANTAGCPQECIALEVSPALFSCLLDREDTHISLSRKLGICCPRRHVFCPSLLSPPSSYSSSSSFSCFFSPYSILFLSPGAHLALENI